MRLHRLQLFDYRNFQRLDVELPAKVTLFVGDNAQGKTNVLEAVYLLATLRAVRAEADVQLVRRELLSEVLPAARVVGEVETLTGALKIEVAVVAREAARGANATKTVKINGAPKRLADAVGRLTAVLFSADDLMMIEGSPSLRRRYIDLTLMQVDQQYSAARSRYERILVQRNHLLRRVREGEAQAEELGFWTEELSKDGGLIAQRRAAALREIGSFAADYHRALAQAENLGVRYEPKIDASPADPAGASAEEMADCLADNFTRGLSRDIAAGMTLQGPHRDEILFALNDLPAAGYASRAQQRSIALSLRLAEAELLRRRRGEAPVLLLDDVLSEMDAYRRQAVLAAIHDVHQLLITGADWDRFPAEFTSGASCFKVTDGAVQAITPAQVVARTADS
ncbi:MAG: DNA replication/repair protein RecF [Chloroflexi bacterium]|nr:MAG: DNA replication/repair protein RecF [Chloroflexota bacterium]